MPCSREEKKRKIHIRLPSKQRMYVYTTTNKTIQNRKSKNSLRPSQPARHNAAFRLRAPREVKDAVRRIERIAKNGQRAQKGRDKKIGPTPSFPNQIPPEKKRNPSAKKLNPHSPEKPPKRNQKKRPPHKFQSANRRRFWNLPPKNLTRQAFNHFQSQLPESHTGVWKTRGWIGGLQHSHHKKKGRDT